MAPQIVGRTAARADAGRSAAAVLSVGLLLFPAVGSAAKQAMAPLAIALAVALLAVTLRFDRRAALPARGVAMLYAGFAAYVAFLHLPPELGGPGSGETITKLAMLAVVLWLASGGWTAIAGAAGLGRIAQWALGGLAVGSGFLLVELVFDSPIHRLADGLDWSVRVDPSRHNRPAVALLLLSLPLAGLLARRVGGRHAAAAIALGIAPALIGQSAAGWLAACVAAAVFIPARRWPRATLAVGGILVVGFVVAAPPILATAYRVTRQHEVAMPLSFADRLEIWDHAADAVGDAPWTGRGLGAVSHLPMSEEQRARYVFHKAPATHGHNAAIQLWVEFGAVGIAFGIAVLATGAAAIRRMDDRTRPVALATASALLVVAMLSFGVWQETWLGLIGVTIAMLRLAALPPEPESAA